MQVRYASGMPDTWHLVFVNEICQDFANSDAWQCIFSCKAKIQVEAVPAARYPLGLIRGLTGRGAAGETTQQTLLLTRYNLCKQK